MNEKLVDILPIGSVVIVGNREMMVAGYSTSVKDGNKYDYVGLLYPVGRINDDVYLFNKIDIEKVIFIRYQGFNYFEFKKEMNKLEGDPKNG